MDILVQNRKLLALAAAALLLFSGYILLYKLGNEPFQDYDEATYALITRAGIQQGEPTALSFLNEPFLRKPPLLFWMTTAGARVFHSAEFADRLPSALAGIAAVVLVALICLEAGTGGWTALAAGAILATTAAWMETARAVRFDTLVSFFDIAALYVGMRASRDSRWFLMVGIVLALAVLSKSVIALFGGIAVLIVLLYEKRFPHVLRDRYFWFGIGVFFLIAAPWHLYMTLAYGAAFWHSYLGTEVLQRASTNLFPGGGNPTNAQYFDYLQNTAAPWTEAFVLALLCTSFVLRSLPRKARPAFLAAAASALSVLAVMFDAKTKAYAYLAPLFPFAAVTVALAGGVAWEWLSTAAPSRAVRAAFISGCLVLFAVSGAFARYHALHLDPYYSWQISQAYEERDVGRIIRAAPSPEVYAHEGYDFLGSLYYYSVLPDTPNPYVLLWSASSTPSATSTDFILATSSLAALSAEFPEYRFVQDYSGRFVSLFTVVPPAAPAR